MEEIEHVPEEGRDWQKWNEDRPREAKELALLGLTDEVMARVMGIGLGTLDGWKRKYPEFLAALNEGKLRADAKVAAALYKRATGYTVKEQHVNTANGMVVVTEVDKEIPPDPWSAAKWLSLRQRALWSETQRLEITNTNININKFDFTGISDEDMLVIKKIGLGQIKRLDKHAEGN
jgi:hypothetical protein